MNKKNNKHWVQCILCHCIPKPDEWSTQVNGVCIDCG